LKSLNLAQSIRYNCNSLATKNKLYVFELITLFLVLNFTQIRFAQILITFAQIWAIAKFGQKW